jgi:hypothetical protein
MNILGWKNTTRKQTSMRLPMTKLALFISVVLILIIYFFSYKKHTHILSLIFTLFIIEYVLTSVIAIIVDNTQLWKVSKNHKDFFLFRLTEVVVFPLLLLIFLDYVKKMKTVVLKLLFLITCTLLLFCVEQLLILLNLFQYGKWQPAWSIGTWFLLVVLGLYSQTTFNKVLKKEGVMK